MMGPWQVYEIGNRHSCWLLRSVPVWIARIRVGLSWAGVGCGGLDADVTVNGEAKGPGCTRLGVLSAELECAGVVGISCRVPLGSCIVGVVGVWFKLVGVPTRSTT